MGSYSNPSFVSRLRTILAGQDRDPVSDRSTETRQIQRRLSPEDVAELVAAHEEGASQQELAARFGIFRTTVAAHLKRHGLTSRRGGLTAKQITEAIQLYNSGWSLAKIAAHFGVYPTSIYYRLRKIGVQIRPRPGWSD
jgi:transposase-like protein